MSIANLTIRYYYTPIRMVKIQNTDTTKYRWGCGKKEMLIHCLVGMQNGTVTLEDNLAVAYKTKIPYDSATRLLGIHPKEMKTYTHKNT